MLISLNQKILKSSLNENSIILEIIENFEFFMDNFLWIIFLK